MSAPETRSSLTRDTTWLVGAKLTAAALGLLLPLVLVRRLDQVEFGLYKQIFLLVTTVGVLLPLGFVMSGFYFLSRVQDRAASVVANILLVYVAVGAMAGGALFVWPGAIGAVFDEPALTPYARPVAVALFLTVASSFLDLLALASGHVRRAAAFIVLMQISKTASLATAAIVTGSISGVLVAAVAHGVLQFGLLAGYVRSAFGPVWRRVDPALLRAQVSYAIPLGLATGWLFWLQTEAHHYFVARATSPDVYALYAVGCVGLPLTAMLAESLGSLMIRSVSRLHSDRRHEEIIAVVTQAMRGLALFYFPLYTLLVVVGRDLITVLYTTQYGESWTILAINLTIMPFAIVSVPSDAIVRSFDGCRRYMLGVRAGLVLLLLPALWLVTPRFGPVAAISLVIGFTVIERLLIAARAARVLGLERRHLRRLRPLGDIAGAAVLAGIGAWLARAVAPGAPLAALSAGVAVFGISYAAALLGLDVLTAAERAAARRHLASFASRLRRPVRTRAEGHAERRLSPWARFLETWTYR